MSGKYYLINRSGVHSANTKNRLDQKLEISTEDTDYKCFGSDKVFLATTEDMTFIRDKKRLSMIPMERLYKKDTTTKLLIIITTVLSFLNFIQK